MKALSVTARVLVIVSAAVTLILRFLTYKYEEVFGADVLNTLNIVAYSAAGVLLVAGLVWIFVERKLNPQPKRSRKKTRGQGGA